MKKSLKTPALIIIFFFFFLFKFLRSLSHRTIHWTITTWTILTTTSGYAYVAYDDANASTTFPVIYFYDTKHHRSAISSAQFSTATVITILF